MAGADCHGEDRCVRRTLELRNKMGALDEWNAEHWWSCEQDVDRAEDEGLGAHQAKRGFCYTNASASSGKTHQAAPGDTLLQTMFGEWLSLVEHLVRDQGVGGSNPLSPTIIFNKIQQFS